METNNETILIVDDHKPNREVLEDILTPLGFNTIHAENGLSALAHMDREDPDLILLDILMPEMDGHEVLKRMREKSIGIPVVVVSALDDADNIAKCLRQGAVDVLPKPVQMEVLKARVDNCLRSARAKAREELLMAELENYNLRLEERVNKQVDSIVRGHIATTFALSKLAESRDPETGEHLDRMRVYCKLLAKRMGEEEKFSAVITKGFVQDIYVASPLHDIGKVGVPDRVLRKRGKLTKVEFDLVKKHPEIGAETLRAVQKECPDNKFVNMGVEIAQNHHEKWNGSGYPEGLSGEEIPLSARILAAADVYDALTSKRCYKEAVSHEDSCVIIMSESGEHFDPDVVSAFRDIEGDLLLIRQAVCDSPKSLLE